MKLNLLICPALLLLLLWPLPGGADTIPYTYDDIGNRKAYAVAVNALQPGDINNDGAVTFGGAVLSQKMLSGHIPESPVFTSTCINDNQQIDMTETIFIKNRGQVYI